MKTSKIITLKIGDSLFAHVAMKGVFTYNVVGVRTYPETCAYEVECQSCSDHDKCRLLVVQVDNQSKFKYVCMLNDNEDNEQYYWHSENEYFTSMSECKNAAYKKAVDHKRKEITTLELKLEEARKSLAEIVSLIKG